MFFTLPFFWHLSILRWQDSIEILLFSIGIYFFSQLLAQDSHKPLLLSFYGYCSVLALSSYCGLPTISTLLTLLAPLVLAVFILLHHRTLQKKFITLTAIKPSQQVGEDWIQLIIRASLSAAGQQKSITFLLEKNDSLETIVEAAQIIDSPLSLPLLQLIIRDSLVKQDVMIWINAETKVHAYHVAWSKNSIDRWLTEEVATQEPWIQDALFFTKKADLLIVQINPTSRTFTLIAQGKIIEQASSQTACSVIKQYFSSSHFLAGETYVNNTTTHSRQQSRS